MNTHNVGKIDRVVRLVLGLTLFGLYYSGWINPEINQYLLFGAFMLIVTSFRSCCPFYMLLGRGTCSSVPISNSKKIETIKMDVRKYN